MKKPWSSWEIHFSDKTSEPPTWDDSDKLWPQICARNNLKYLLADVESAGQMCIDKIIIYCTIIYYIYLYDTWDLGCFKDGIRHGSFNTSTGSWVLWPLRRMARILENIWPNLHSPRTYHWTSSQRKPVGPILDQLRLVVYPIIYKVLYIPGGAGFRPSTVCTKPTDWFELFINCIFSTFYFLAWQTCIWGMCRFSYGPPVARTFSNLPKKHVSCTIFP